LRKAVLQLPRGFHAVRLSFWIFFGQPGTPDETRAANVPLPMKNRGPDAPNFLHFPIVL
jgi:hypothetical protein